MLGIIDQTSTWNRKVSKVQFPSTNKPNTSMYTAFSSYPDIQNRPEIFFQDDTPLRPLYFRRAEYVLLYSILGL